MNPNHIIVRVKSAIDKEIHNIWNYDGMRKYEKLSWILEQ